MEKHFSAFFWTSGEGRARRSPVIHYLDCASLAWGFLIFFPIPMRVVKSDWNPHPHACRKRRLCDLVSVPLSSLYTYVFAGLCASLAGVASQAGDADPSRAPGLTSGPWTEPGVLACTLLFTVILKNPAKCLWRWEPDRRYIESIFNFLSNILCPNIYPLC